MFHCHSRYHCVVVETRLPSHPLGGRACARPRPLSHVCLTCPVGFRSSAVARQTGGLVLVAGGGGGGGVGRSEAPSPPLNNMTQMSFQGDWLAYVETLVLAGFRGMRGLPPVWTASFSGARCQLIAAFQKMTVPPEKYTMIWYEDSYTTGTSCLNKHGLVLLTIAQHVYPMATCVSHVCFCFVFEPCRSRMGILGDRFSFFRTGLHSSGITQYLLQSHMFFTNPLFLLYALHGP